jgi:hypothetical protein
VYAALEKPTTA